MSLNTEFFERTTNISAKVIADSINENGDRITTLEVEAPRIILAEINTHNAISKNCSSTRAITLEKAIQQVIDNGFVPLYWGEKKAGMSATNEISDIDYAKEIWESAKQSMIGQVNLLDEERVHKQTSGRLLEPFQMVKQVLTATDWDNFFNLRIHKDSQPEICMLAYKIYKAIDESKPNLLCSGEYHLPYVNIIQNDYETYYNIFVYDDEIGNTLEHVLTLEEAIRVSVSCVAQVSYRNTDMSLEKADKIFDMLVKSDVLHASCFEHLSTPIKNRIDGLGIVRVNCGERHSWEDGITHKNKQGQLCSGNLRGFISYRQQLPNNTCWKFDFEERMKMFE